MKLDITIKVDFKPLEKLINKELLKQNMMFVLREHIGPEYINLVMQEFNEFSLHFDPEDPASPQHWEEEFREHLLQNLTSNLTVEGNVISLGLGEKSFLGYNQGEIGPRDDTPLVWMVFYLEGLIGQYAFISESIYREKKGDGADLNKYGRFGGGFMISEADYMDEGWDTFKPFSEAKFPFGGGQRPKSFFKEAWEKVELKEQPFKDAVIATLKGRTL